MKRNIAVVIGAVLILGTAVWAQNSPPKNSGTTNTQAPQASPSYVIGPDDTIFGYTIFNDWSARDLQGREMQVNLGPAKGKDFAGTLGPWLVTADELERHKDADGFLELECVATVNDVDRPR